MREFDSAGGYPSEYRDNPLIEACGPPLSRLEIAKRLVHFPPMPPASASLPPETLEHHVASTRRLHIPTDTGIRLAHAINLMMRQGYVHRSPKSPTTWRRIYSQIGSEADFSPLQLAATVTGLAGMGKSTAIERALQLYPQVVQHESFPGLVGPVQQLLWLKIDVPSSGKIRDLVESLARATDAALNTRFADELVARRGANGASLAHRWLQKISCHFPGVIVLDEVQNLFKIARKAVREAAAHRPSGPRPTLHIADDEALKLLLTITNTSKIPTVWCSTPDGLEAFTTRMSTSQRLLTAGLHIFQRPVSADDEFFSKIFFPALCRYQWLPQKTQPSPELCALLFTHSAGIPRICLTLWIEAHGQALRRGAKVLEPQDLMHAAERTMAPLSAGVRALISEDMRVLQHYEDATSPNLLGSR